MKLRACLALAPSAAVVGLVVRWQMLEQSQESGLAAESPDGLTLEVSQPGVVVNGSQDSLTQRVALPGVVAVPEGEPQPLRFPYGRCWPGSGEECSRPFRWAELSESELEKALSPFELATLHNSSCNVNVTNSSFPAACCPGVACQRSKCDAGPLPGRCRSTVGTKVAYNHTFRYELVFRTWPGPARPLFSLADALALLPRGSRMAFVGDSTNTQMFLGLLCNLARSGQVTSLTMLQDVVVRGRRCNEVNVTLSGDLGMRRLVLFRETTFVAETSTSIADRLLAIFCSDVDVLVFNTGLWFNWEWKGPSNQTMLAHIAAELAGAMDRQCKGVVTIFRGTLMQHFTTFTGEFPTNEATDHAKAKAALAQMNETGGYGNCRPLLWNSQGYSQLTVVAEESPEQRYDWRNYQVVDAYARAGYDVAITPWGREHAAGCRNSSRRTLHYIPMGEVTADRYDLHPGGSDCTHMCIAPAIHDVITDGIFLALRQVRQHRKRSPCSELDGPCLAPTRAPNSHAQVLTNAQNRSIARRRAARRPAGSHLKLRSTRDPRIRTWFSTRCLCA
jgi:hypothetical protein